MEEKKRNKTNKNKKNQIENKRNQNGNTDPVRSLVLDMLVRVFRDAAYASRLLKEEKDLSASDAGFASEILYGTIRNKTLLEYQWKPFVKEGRKTALRTALLLDMSVYQLFFMDRTPDYAVINEAVNLAKANEKGFVNAVLRNVLKAGLQESDDLTVQYSHPEWIVSLWKAHYGEEQTKKILSSDQERPQLYGRINTLKVKKEDVKGTFVNEYSFIPETSLFDGNLLSDGAVLVQDVHSASVPLWLEVEKGMRVLDVCAAPGTKTQMIGMLMENEGYILAQDLYEKRAADIASLMEKTGVSIVETRCGDACDMKDLPDASFDRILCDVPCSGLGDLSHKPEIRWNTKPEDLDSMIEVQKGILEASARLLKEEGILVYSTCTLNRKENENQVKRFVSEHPEFELVKEETLFPGPGDGFYRAQLKKHGRIMGDENDL